MEIFNLVFRTILSQVEHYERNSWDWPREVSRVFGTLTVDMLVKIEKCLLVSLSELQHVLRQHAAEEKIIRNTVDTETVGR